MITALLFDFDGVIVDTEVPTYQSWRDTYASTVRTLLSTTGCPQLAVAAPRPALSMRWHISSS